LHKIDSNFFIYKYFIMARPNISLKKALKDNLSIDIYNMSATNEEKQEDSANLR
jgi:hypothetical protein